MKNKKIISLAALALTASLFLGACGGNKEEKTSEASSSKTSLVKQTSSSSKKKVITSKDPIASSSSDSKSEESHTVGSKITKQQLVKHLLQLKKRHQQHP